MRTRAIILKKQNTNEYDQLITCYTEEFGKITAVAKSSLRPTSIQAMHLDIFNLVEFELINGRGMPIITGAQAESTYSNLKSNLSCLAVAYFFVETADKLFFEYQKDDEVWQFFISLFDELNYHGHHVKHGAHGNFLRKKQVEFLDILGYSPSLGQCVFCLVSISGRPEAYSIEAKGAICRDCFLGGQRGVVMRDGNLFDLAVIGSIFENLAEKKIYSLKLISNIRPVP